jgi:F-type H+-transporting ATPase subunit gamma
VIKAVKEEDLNLPILEVREVKKVSLVVVTGDRGLCGGYNNQVIKAATNRLNKLKSQGIDVSHFLSPKSYSHHLHVHNTIRYN